MIYNESLNIVNHRRLKQETIPWRDILKWSRATTLVGLSLITVSCLAFLLKRWHDVINTPTNVNCRFIQEWLWWYKFIQKRVKFRASGRKCLETLNMAFNGGQQLHWGGYGIVSRDFSHFHYVLTDYGYNPLGTGSSLPGSVTTHSPSSSGEVKYVHRTSSVCGA